MALLAFQPKRLFMEKPLVARHGQAHVEVGDFWDAKKLLQKANDAGAEVAMVFNYRFSTNTAGPRLIKERASEPNRFSASHYATWDPFIDLILLLGGGLSQITGQRGGRFEAIPKLARPPTWQRLSSSTRVPQGPSWGPTASTGTSPCSS